MPHAKVSPSHREKAKKLRQTMTPAETLLWRYIKADRIEGFSFRRQMPFKNYIADFACLSAKLIVELDGMSHESAQQIAADKVRDEFFADQGFRVLRFANADVLSNLEGVLASLREALKSANVLPPSLSLPRKGGGNDAAVRAAGDRGLQS